MEFSCSFPDTHSLHNWYRLRMSLVFKRLLILHHKPLYNQSACEVICSANGLNLGMWNFIKKVSVHYEFALGIVCQTISISETKHDGARQTLQDISFLLGSVVQSHAVVCDSSLSDGSCMLFCSVTLA